MELTNEAESLESSVEFLAKEYKNMDWMVSEKERELEDAIQETQIEIDEEKSLFTEVISRIEGEKDEIVGSITRDLQYDMQDKTYELNLLEGQIASSDNEIKAAKEMFNNIKNNLLLEARNLERNIKEEEERTLQRDVDDLTYNLQEVEGRTNQLKAEEGEIREKIKLISAMLEEKKKGAIKIITQLKGAFHILSQQHRALKEEEGGLEMQFRKREELYRGLYEETESEETEINSRIRGFQQELEELINFHGMEDQRINNHIEQGKERLDKILFAIGEFKEENKKMHERNDKAIGSLRSNLSEFVKTINK